MASTDEITVALKQLHAGDPDARSRLIQLVYHELHRLAGRQLRRERPNHTLQSTALVNEMYLKLLAKGDRDWQDRAHFFGAAACAMRHILVDHARAVRAERRGGHLQRTEFEDSMPVPAGRVEDILSVDQALSKLGQMSPRQESIVEMRFYAGYTEEEVAEILRLSVRTVKREWAVARAWLHGEIRGREQTGADSA
jgi:RNA polymerase sigma factor (TIGR02999 family)